MRRVRSVLNLSSETKQRVLDEMRADLDARLAMTPAAQTSEPQTEAGRELVEIAPQLWRQPSNRSMPMEPMQLEIRKAVLAIESEAQRLTVERRIDLTEIAAAMLRGEQACERGHRAGEINAHVHFDQLQRWARRLAALAREEAGEY